jgi:hypothetical protein
MVRVEMETKIGILRSPRAGCYLIINDRGIPRRAKEWKEAVLALRAITLEPTSAIEAMKPEIDAGKMMHLRPRRPGN